MQVSTLTEANVTLWIIYNTKLQLSEVILWSYLLLLKNLCTLNEISYCSPPQISRPVSYPPSSQNHFLSTANSPPAITGDLEETNNTQGKTPF